EINLLGNNLDSIVSPQISGISELERLFLSNNSLEGPIPSSLGQLTHLTHLYFSSNDMSGTIPPSIGNLPLQWLVLHHNTNLGGCYHSNLSNLWNTLNVNSSTNSNISDFTALGDWEDFVNCHANMCPCGITNKWNGGNGDWTDAAKWNQGHVPLICENVMIDLPGVIVTVPAGVDYPVKNITLKNGARLNISLTAKLNPQGVIPTDCNN
ncbi:MAG: hypothetical protein HKN68_20035, partial [Saprospiraceae bacterium]|nr:hypothetical protein [Saprospiraceae bacterium]